MINIPEYRYILIASVILLLAVAWFSLRWQFDLGYPLLSRLRQRRTRAQPASNEPERQ